MAVQIKDKFAIARLLLEDTVLNDNYRQLEPRDGVMCGWCFARLIVFNIVFDI